MQMPSPPPSQGGPQRMFPWGVARVLCHYPRKLGGAHELTQQSSTLKYFRHFNFYYNLNHISTALRIEENLLPRLHFCFNESINFPSELWDGTQQASQRGFAGPHSLPPRQFSLLLLQGVGRRFLSLQFLQKGLPLWKEQNLILNTEKLSLKK